MTTSSMTLPRSLRGLLVVAAALVAMLVLAGTASARDRNHDHIPDKWEKHFHLSLRVNQARRDQDHDGVKNLAEFRHGTNPRRANSSDSGRENAGTIVSFDAATGLLTIQLAGSEETISGQVTEETEIECGCGHHAEEGEEEVISLAARGTTVRHEGRGESGEEGGSEESGSDDESSEEENEDGPEHSGCSAEDLVAGATVKAARLETIEGVATFTKVELGHGDGGQED
jgi:hypothetical protein